MLRYMTEELQNKFSQWLGIPDPSTNYHAALQKRHPETGQWLFNDEHFTDWRCSEASLMWLHGKGTMPRRKARPSTDVFPAGCGKTILR
jgi:hypothetical protein